MTCGRLPYNDKSLKHLIEQTKKKVVFPEKLNLSSGKNHLKSWRSLMDKSFFFLTLTLDPNVVCSGNTLNWQTHCRYFFLELRELIHGILVYDSSSRMSLHEILFHPWLAMIKVPKQVGIYIQY